MNGSGTGRVGRVAGLLCVTAVAIGGAATAIASGGSSASAIKASENYPLRAVHQVRAPAKAAATYKYLQTKPFTLDPSTENGGTAKCPKGYSAISGYWASDGVGVVSDFNSVGKSQRQWSTGVLNLDSSSHQAVVGAVCAQN